MCVIVHNWFNKQFNKEEMQHFYELNNDGTGLYYYNMNTGKVTIKKWPRETTFNEIWQTLNSLYKHKQIRNVAVHFRYSTSGGEGERQIHPMKMSNGMYLMHNGVLPAFEFDTRIMSDTQVMAFWLDNVFDKKNIKDLSDISFEFSQELENVFQYNKVLLLHKQCFRILNQNLGEWRNDIWYSCKSYYNSDID